MKSGTLSRPSASSRSRFAGVYGLAPRADELRVQGKGSKESALLDGFGLNCVRASQVTNYIDDDLYVCVCKSDLAP